MWKDEDAKARDRQALAAAAGGLVAAAAGDAGSSVAAAVTVLAEAAATLTGVALESGRGGATAATAVAALVPPPAFISDERRRIISSMDEARRLRAAKITLLRTRAVVTELGLEGEALGYGLPEERSGGSGEGNASGPGGSALQPPQPQTQHGPNQPQVPSKQPLSVRVAAIVAGSRRLVGHVAQLRARRKMAERRLVRAAAAGRKLTADTVAAKAKVFALQRCVLCYCAAVVFSFPLALRRDGHRGYGRVPGRGCRRRHGAKVWSALHPCLRVTRPIPHRWTSGAHCLPFTCP
jgi:hypothetical protein